MQHVQKISVVGEEYRGTMGFVAALTERGYCDPDILNPTEDEEWSEPEIVKTFPETWTNAYLIARSKAIELANKMGLIFNDN